MRLNVSALSDPNSLCIPLVSPLVCAPDHLQPIPIQTLVDSESTHCFLDSAFACGHSLPTTPTLPVELCLFDRTSNNIISKVVSLPVKLSLLQSPASVPPVETVRVTGHKTLGESSVILQSVVMIQLTSRRILRN